VKKALYPLQVSRQQASNARHGKELDRSRILIEVFKIERNKKLSTTARRAIGEQNEPDAPSEVARSGFFAALGEYAYSSPLSAKPSTSTPSRNIQVTSDLE